MCTVTYIPKGDSSFIFTSNRDEAPGRSVKGMILAKEYGKQLLYPKDAKAGGTWIAASDAGQLVCILNGAFEKHKHRPPYRLSRGIMALNFFGYADTYQFFSNFDFIEMEPFTMIIYDQEKLYDLRWDGQEKHLTELDINDTHIWSSCTLYTKEWQEERVTWFEDWKMEHHDFSREAILDFHQFGGDGDPWKSLVMNRHDMVRTVSITCILKTRNKLQMHYKDLMHDSSSDEELPLIA